MPLGSREKSCLLTSSPAAEFGSHWSLCQQGRRDWLLFCTSRTNWQAKWAERESRLKEVWRGARNSGWSVESVSTEGSPITMLQRSWEWVPIHSSLGALHLLKKNPDCEVLLDFRDMGENPTAQRTPFQVFLMWFTWQIWGWAIRQDSHRSHLAYLFQECSATGMVTGEIIMLKTSVVFRWDKALDVFMRRETSGEEQRIYLFLYWKSFRASQCLMPLELLLCFKG